MSFDKIVEALIKEAQERGEFDNQPSKGKPIDLTTYFETPGASKLMSSNAWCGFYLAVRVAGTLRAGECFELVPGPREVGIVELFRARVAAQRR